MSPLLLSLLLSPAAPAKPLWTEWYLISRNGEAVSLYEEVAEARPKEKEIAITQRWVEKQGGRSEVYIGSVAGEDRLAPVAFFVERKGAKPYKIDGRVKDKSLDITFKPAFPGPSKTHESTPVTPGMYFSSFLPAAISRKFKGGKDSFAFTAVVEDAGDMNVEVKGGTVEVTTLEKKFGKETCRKATLSLGGAPQEWWIAKSGKVCFVEFTDSGTKLELTTEKAAKKALGEAN